MPRSPTVHSSSPLLLTSLILTGFLGSACVPPASEGRLPPESAPPFSVTMVRPLAGSTEVARNGAVVLQFSDFPDPESLTYPALSIGPRGDLARVTMTVSLVDRQVQLVPVVPLLAKTEIVVSVGRGVQSLAGQPLPRSFEAVFRTAESLAPAMPAPPSPTLGQLLAPGATLAARCDLAGCHARLTRAGARQEPAAGLDFSLGSDDLRRHLLSGRRGGIEGLLWVEPGRPERSYLLRKLLAAEPGSFTRITGSAMPLQGAALPPDGLRTIETWIRAGAP